MRLLTIALDRVFLTFDGLTSKIKVAKQALNEELDPDKGKQIEVKNNSGFANFFFQTF